MNPTTGDDVRRVHEGLVQALIARHHDQAVYLGRVYRSWIRLPTFVRDYTSNATGGAFHVGIFGRSGSGSGRTALATYWLAMQVRHAGLSLLVFSPQGHFTQAISDQCTPFSPHQRPTGNRMHIERLLHMVVGGTKTPKPQS